MGFAMGIVSPSTIHTTLVCMEAMLAPAGSWTQGVDARDTNDQPCDPSAPHAVARCIYGALTAACALVAPGAGLTPEDLEEAVDEFLFDLWGATASAINDSSAATHARVQGRLREAHLAAFGMTIPSALAA